MNSDRISKPQSLVTGGAGFIGSHVAKYCLELGHDVVVLDDLSGGFRDQVPDGAKFIHGSVTDQTLVSRLFKQYRFDHVYHLAAYAAVGLSHFIRRFNYTVNLLGTVNLINEAVRHQIKCFVFTSSISVYGTAEPPMDENTIAVPEDPYGVSKYAAELDLLAAQRQFDLRFVIFRPHNVYGEHQNTGDPYRNVLGIFMNQILSGEPLTVFGDGQQTRAFTHVDDVAPHIARCVDNPHAWNQIFNIGADEPYTINDLAKRICRAFSVPLNVRYLPARNEIEHVFSSHEKVRRILGAEPTIDLDTGIPRMADWVRATGQRASQPLNSIELSRTLPPSWERFITFSA